MPIAVFVNLRDEREWINLGKRNAHAISVLVDETALHPSLPQQGHQFGLPLLVRKEFLPQLNHERHPGELDGW